MFEQATKSVQFGAFFTATKVGKTGLTVTVDVLNEAGTVLVSAASATAVGGGVYIYTYTTPAGQHDYYAIFKTADATVDFQHVPSYWTAGRTWTTNIDAAISGVAAAVWAVAARTLTAFGFTVDILQSAADKVWGTVARTLTAFGFTVTLTAGEHTNIAADAQTGLTAQGYTTARAGFLDVLNGIVAAIWAAATRTLTALGVNVTVGGYAAGQDPATLALDTAAAGHNLAASIGQKINAAGSAADPLLNAVPGAYGVGTAGAALGAVADVKAKTDLIVTGAAITLTSPVGAGGNVVVYAGDDYPVADSRQLIWSTTNSGAWPDLVGATVKFYSQLLDGITMVASAPSGANKSVYLELTTAQTLAAGGGTYNFQIRATLADGSIVTLVTGTIAVLSRIA